MGGTDEDGLRGAREEEVGGGITPLTGFDPSRIGPYLLLGRLGAGGMGRVFLARSDSGRTVAVKVVHEEHASDGRFRARFRREIEAASRVAERYTAPVLDSGPDAEPPWVATGYVPGLSLEQVVRGHGALPTVSVHALADGLLRALKDIHDAGIVHRDLKPSNVMLTVDGAKVVDFGIARALEASVESLLTSTGMVVGSPGFMSPEQVRGQDAGPGSDVFTVGCVLTYAATGRLPFGHGASNQHAVMYQIVQDEPDLTGLDDPALRTLVERCLIKDPAQRPDVDALLAGLGRPDPAAAGSAWLPADVVTHLAQQAARLLDAEARPLRDEPVDRSTVGLRAGAEPPLADPPPVVVAGAGTKPEKRERRPRRRRVFVALPVVVVLTVGGGTMAVLQPWSQDRGGAHAQSPGRNAEPTPTPSDTNTSSKPSSSPSKASDGKGGKEEEKGDAGQSEDAAGGDKEQAGSRSSAPAGGGSMAGSSGSASGGSGGSGGSSTGSPPPAMTGYKVAYKNSCVGACDMPLLVSWSAVSRATRYDVHYTNKGSDFTKKNVDTVYSTGGTAYTVQGPFSGDEICIAVRAANKYGASAWAETWCGTVPY
ncbi:serine/threonine-protein kinase [Streptomyces sp. NPDC050400]|uniref:serine/threonine-protein kinase n=1 Tax=Streptomyces sp. NPDC050400 TaxID=3365610 RepID=UPI0037A64C7A